MSTLAKKFKIKAKQLMPHQPQLQELNDDINELWMIDDIMFRKGEYIGGMAAVLIELIDNDNS